MRSAKNIQYSTCNTLLSLEDVFVTSRVRSSQFHFELLEFLHFSWYVASKCAITFSADIKPQFLGSHCLFTIHDIWLGEMRELGEHSFCTFYALSSNIKFLILKDYPLRQKIRSWNKRNQLEDNRSIKFLFILVRKIST